MSDTPAPAEPAEPAEPADGQSLGPRPGDIVMLFRLEEDGTASPLAAHDAILAALRHAGLLPADESRSISDGADIADFRRRGRFQPPIVRRYGRTSGWR